ncbi:membrane protein [Pyrococcus abyssi virus 1]|uniref:membrane protein n=1 Tax=Pyrococcus abyssi virus 1 TaxID=425386 RepID=UPI00015529C2|nr:membrane protein [Pyrococcus abyssi virus 1]ABN58501.1 membrane protein [Pyrococcus abyssi virus 1]
MGWLGLVFYSIAVFLFAIVTRSDYTKAKVKRLYALLFEIIAFIGAGLLWGWLVALFIYFFAKAVAFLLAKFRIIRAVDIWIYTGYVLLVGNFLWTALSTGIMFAISIWNGREGAKKSVPLSPVLFLLFLIYIGILGVS